MCVLRCKKNICQDNRYLGQGSKRISLEYRPATLPLEQIHYPFKNRTIQFTSLCISFTLQGGSFRGLIMKHPGGDCFPSAVFFHGRIQNTSADWGENKGRKLSETSPSCSHCCCLLLDEWTRANRPAGCLTGWQVSRPVVWLRGRNTDQLTERPTDRSADWQANRPIRWLTG